MAMGQQKDRQRDLMVGWSEMPRSPGHVFYDPCGQETRPRSRRARHIRGRETRQYPNFPRNPPTVSEGGYSDPSFCRCRDRVRAGLSPEFEQPTLIFP